MSTRLALRCALLAAALFVACSSEQSAPTSTQTSSESDGFSTPGKTSPAISLGRTGAQLAFMATNAGLQAQAERYAASVADAGFWEFRAPLVQGNLRLETVAAGRAATVAAKPGHAQLGPDGQVIVPRGDFEEQLRSTPLGVEQSWHFAKRPAGKGDYVLRIAVSGLPYLGKTPSGHHFGVDRDRPGLRYGSATFVDATGTETGVQVGYEAGALVLRLAESVLDQAAFPAVLDPLLGVESELDVPVFETRAGASGNPSAAFNGTHFLVAYEEQALGQAPISIQIARTTAEGSVIDGAGTKLGDGFTPTVASDGKDFLVSYFVKSPTDNVRFSLVAQRVSAAGARIGSALALADNAVQGVTRAGAQQYGTYAVQPGKVASAFGAGTYLVVYETDTGDVYGRRVSTAGVVSPAFVLTTGVGTQSSPSVAFNGTHFLATWQDSRANQAISAVRIAPDGTLLEPLGIAVTNNGTRPQVASDGVGFVVAWHRSPVATTSTIHAARVDATGTVVDTTPIALPTPAGAVAAGVSVTWDGSSYLLAWQTGAIGTRSVFGTRLAAAGNVIDNPAFMMLNEYSDSFEPRAVGGPAGTALVFARAGTGGSGEPGYAYSSVRAAPISAGALKSPGRFVVSVTATSNTPIAAATSSAGQFVAWKGNGKILGTRLSDAGAILDVPSKVLLPPPFQDKEIAMASDGTNFAMAASFVDGVGGIQLLRFDAKGTYLGFVGLNGKSPQGPAIAFDGTEYLVVWSDTRNGVERDIYGARITPDGILLDPTGIAICTVTKNQVSPAVASNGNGFFVVWDDPRSGLGADASDIYGARVARDGTVLDANGFAISTANVGQHAPSVAFDGKDYVVAWEDGRNDALEPGIYAARVTTLGVLVDKKGVALSNGPGAKRKPSIAATGDGQTLLAAWEDTRLGHVDIRGTWLAQGLRVLDPDGAILAGGEGDELVPRLSIGRGGRNVLAYGRASPFTGTPQATIRMLEAGLGVGQACASSDACALRFCADGFCCEEACDKACRTCGATPGKCTNVAQAEDPGTCSGANSCNATGECAKKLGNVCARGTDCASGFCTDGVCCDSACSGGCDVCNVVPGKCTIVPAGDTGANPSCLPGVCDGRSAQCTASCTTDAQCSPGTYCASDGQCRAACANDAECPKGAACDVATRRCIARARCIDDRTLESQEVRTSCAPYRCTDAACGTRCTSVADCASPAACDADGRCVLPTADPPASGCSQSRGSTPGLVDSSLFGLAVGLALRRRKRRRGAHSART